MRVPLSDEAAPRYPHIIALPLLNRPVFPGLVTSVTLTDPTTIEALENLFTSGNGGLNTASPAGDSMSAGNTVPGAGAGYVGCFLRKNHTRGVTEHGIHLPTPEVITDASDLYTTGTFARIHSIKRSSRKKSSGSKSSHAQSYFVLDSESDDDEASNESSSSNPFATVILSAQRRIDLESVDALGPPIDVTVSHWSKQSDSVTTLSYPTQAAEDTIRALSNEIIGTIREVAQLNQLFRESLQFVPMRLDVSDPYRLADFAAAVSASGTPEDLQSVLAEKDPETRLHKALVLLHREREVSKLQKEISAKVEEKMTEAQRKYFLMEQLKSIKKELGMERDDKEALIEKYRQKIAQYSSRGATSSGPDPDSTVPPPSPAIPTEVMDTIEAELEKFSTLEKNSPEYQVTRSYLDWLVAVPWGVVTEERLDLSEARAVLDRDHYGLDEVKDTILQFIAVGKLRGTVEGKILW
jgi:ATP-dependent Lon protease